MVNLSILMGDQIQERIGQEGACGLGLRNQKDYAQWQSEARHSASREQHGQRSGGQTAWGLGSILAGSKGAWKKQRNPDLSSDSASSLTSLGLGQVA